LPVTKPWGEQEGRWAGRTGPIPESQAAITVLDTLLGSLVYLGRSLIGQRLAKKASGTLTPGG